MTSGIVYLIGAGPGDPGLITARGLKYLSAADVVIHDHLVHPALLRHARADAETLDVGLAAPRPLDQEAICYLLAEKAREGKTVARLKWGDPFVFDSGGAEALFLHEQGLRFEVVPGVPAGIAAPAYAGIPVTYPGGGDTLTFVRGSEGGGEGRAEVDWAAAARLDGTLVCHGGPDQIAQAAGALLAHGEPPEASAALVYGGTLAAQQTIAGTLDAIARHARASTDERPAVLVVGRVAALREHLRWFDARPLFGRRVLVTRPRDQAAELVDALEAAGADAIVAPMIRIEPPDDYGPLDRACRHVREFDVVAFSSAHAVDAFVGRLLAGPLDLRALDGVTLCAVGPATSQRLLRYGLKADVTPGEYRAESLAAAIAAGGSVEGRRVLLPRADIGREALADDLRARGALVTEVVAYRTVAAEADRGGVDVYRLLLERRLDAVTFMSPSAVHALVGLLGAEPAADLLRTTVVASIGPATAEAARQHGIDTTVMPAEHTARGLVEALVRHFAGAPGAAGSGPR